MNIVVMIVLGTATYFIARPSLGTWPAVGLALLVAFLTFKFVVYSATTGTFRAMLNAYCSGRRSGMSPAAARNLALSTRVRAGSRIDATAIARDVEAGSDGNEIADTARMIYLVHCGENGEPPTPEQRVRTANEIAQLCIAAIGELSVK